MDGGADRARPRGEPGGRVAAIDQGTNSTRLLVIEPRSGADPIEISRDMVITRLGQGVDETGTLAPAAIERAIAAIARFTRRAHALHAEADPDRRHVGRPGRGQPRRVPLARPRRDGHRAGGDRRRARGRPLVPRRHARSRSRRRPVPPRSIIGGGSTEFVFGTDTDGRRPRALDTDGKRPADRAGPAFGPSVRRGPRGVRHVDRAVPRRGRASGARSGRADARRRREARRPPSRRAPSAWSATTPTSSTARSSRSPRPSEPSETSPP